MSAAEPLPLDDGYQQAAELNALREQEAREAWERIKARECAMARMFRLSVNAMEAIAADHRTIETELGFSPRNRWNG
jgi:hypothetical protein